MKAVKSTKKRAETKPGSRGQFVIGKALARLQQIEAKEKAARSQKAKSMYIGLGDEKIEIPRSYLGLIVGILENKVHENEEILTTQEVADLLNVSRPFVTKLIDEKKLRGYKVGNQRRVLQKDALEYKSKMRREQMKALQELTDESEELGLDFE